MSDLTWIIENAAGIEEFLGGVQNTHRKMYNKPNPHVPVTQHC